MGLTPDSTPLAANSPTPSFMAVAAANSASNPSPVSADAASASPVSSLLGTDLGGMLSLSTSPLTWAHYLNTQIVAFIASMLRIHA